MKTKILSSDTIKSIQQIANNLTSLAEARQRILEEGILPTELRNELAEINPLTTIDYDDSNIIDGINARISEQYNYLKNLL